MEFSEKNITVIPQDERFRYVVFLPKEYDEWMRENLEFKRLEAMRNTYLNRPKFFAQPDEQICF